MPVPHDYYGHDSLEPHLHNRHNGVPYIEPDWQANLAKDQLPDLSTIGRGPKGDGLLIGTIRQNDTSVSFDILSDLTGEVIATVGPFPTGSIKVYGDKDHDPVAGEVYKFYVDYNVYDPKSNTVKTVTTEIPVPPGAMGSLIYLYDKVLDRSSDDTYQVNEADLCIYNRKKYPSKPPVRVNDIVILETHKKIPATKTAKAHHKYWLTFGTVEAVKNGKVIFTARTFFDYGAIQIYWDSIIDPPLKRSGDDPDVWEATGTLNIWDAIGDKPIWHKVAFSGEYKDLENQPFEKKNGKWQTKEPINVSIFNNDATYQSKKQVEDAIEAAISATYRYKGIVDKYEDLPTNAQNGWVYHVNKKHGEVPAGTNWAWNADEKRWDALGGEINWNGIATEKYVDDKVKTLEKADKDLSDKIDKTLKDSKDYTDEKFKEAKEHSDSNLQEAKDYTDDAVAGLTMDYNDLENKPLTLVPGENGEPDHYEPRDYRTTYKLWNVIDHPDIDQAIDDAISSIEHPADHVKKVVLTQEEYDALEVKDPYTLYETDGENTSGTWGGGNVNVSWDDILDKPEIPTAIPDAEVEEVLDEYLPQQTWPY